MIWKKSKMFGGSLLGVIEGNSPYSKNKTQKYTIRDVLIAHTASPFEK